MKQSFGIVQLLVVSIVANVMLLVFAAFVLGYDNARKDFGQHYCGANITKEPSDG